MNEETKYSTISFETWLRRHPCTKEELWKIQNCLGDTLGWDHPLHKEANKAWMEKD